jgi:hypothetical protein
MSLDNLFESLLAKPTTANEDQDLFAQYLNLDEFDYNYSDQRPTDNGMCHFQAPDPAWTQSQDRLDDSAPLAGAKTRLPYSSSLVPRPTGLGTTATYWNTRATTYPAGLGTAAMSSPCLSGHAYMAKVSSNPQSLAHC